MKRGTMLIIITLLCCLLTACKREKAGSEFEDVAGLSAKTDTPEVTNPPDTKSIQNPSQTPTPTLQPTPIPKPYTGPIAGIMTKEDYPVVDGSTATIPLSEAVYCLATGATAEEAANEIVHTKTSNSYYRLAWKEVDLLIVYAPSEEVLRDLEKGGYKLIIKPIGKDALVFMANASNSIESLTHTQLVDIYSGKITNWSQVGGENEDLLAFQRPVNSGSQTLMLKLVMKYTPMMEGPNVISFESMEGILKAMADYSNEGNTLGYSVFYYAKNMYQMPELKFMKVDGIEPSLMTIYDNTYPYINEFYAVIREDEPENSNARKIFDWLTSEEGQGLVKELGYVPVTMTRTDNTSEYMNPLFHKLLPKDSCYITTSYSNFVEDERIGTVTIYDNEWKLRRIFHNATAGKRGVLPKNSIVSLGYVVLQDSGLYQLKYGLFSLSEEKFLTPIIYDNISVLDEKKGYYIVSKSGDGLIIDRFGNELVSELPYDLWVDVTNNEEGYRLVFYDYEVSSKTYYYFDGNLKLLIKYTDSSQYDNVRLHDEKGNVFFTKELFLKHIGIKENQLDDFYVADYNPGQPLLVVVLNKNTYVLDTKLNIIAQKADKPGTNTYYSAYGDIYLYGEYNSKDESWKGSFYDKSGKLITDDKGNTYGNIYNNQLSNDFHNILYEIKDSTLRILYYEDNRYCEINLGDLEGAYLEYLKNDIGVVCFENPQSQGTRIYRGDKLLYELDELYISRNYIVDNQSDYIVLRSMNLKGGKFKFHYIILDSTGNILYQSEYPEEIICIDQDMMQLERGNYTMIIDYEGNVIMKVIKNDLVSD